MVGQWSEDWRCWICGALIEREIPGQLELGPEQMEMMI